MAWPGQAAAAPVAIPCLEPSHSFADCCLTAIRVPPKAKSQKWAQTAVFPPPPLPPQDVAPRDAGLVLGITNTCGTVLGIAGNIITGYLAGSPLGYQGVWGLTVALHVLATVLWNLGARGERLQLT